MLYDLPWQRLMATAAVLTLVAACTDDPASQGPNSGDPDASGDSTDAGPSEEIGRDSGDIAPEPGTVVGTLRFRGDPVSGASVTLDDFEQVTDSSGHFEFRGVEDGDYDFSATLELLDEGAFVSRTLAVTIDGGLDLAEVLLPEPVTLESPAVTNGTVTLSWTASEDAGFREYKLYTHTTSGLDETTGELLHVATEPDDTEYVHTGIDTPLPSNSTFYYRVYVMDEHGLLGGSNVLAATTSLWEQDEFEAEYVLVRDTQFGGEGQVAGIAHAGDCLWIAYYRAIGGYYDNDEVRVVCRDLESGETLAEHELDDQYVPVAGLAHDGEQLWLNYSTSGAGDRFIRAIDPDSGETTQVFATGDGVRDLAFDGEDLLLNNQWNEIARLDPETGAIGETLDTVFDHSTVRGLAYRQGEYWLVSKAHNQLAVLDESGNHIGIADTDLLEPIWNVVDDLFLTFVGDQLVMVVDSGIYFLDIELKTDE